MKTGKEVLERLLTSEEKGEVLTLFHKNPGLVDTLDGVSRRVVKSKEHIEKDMNDFVELGILRGMKVGKLYLFSLDAKKDEEIQVIIADYFRGLRT
jgi:hypothetical protein